MSKATELAEAIKNYIIVNGLNPKTARTAKDWNEMMGTKYSPATFTATVNAGLMDKWRNKQTEAYRYNIVLTGDLKEKFEEAKKQRAIECARYTVEDHEEIMERHKRNYEEAIARAEKLYKDNIDFETKRYNEALALLENSSSKID